MTDRFRKVATAAAAAAMMAVGAQAQPSQSPIPADQAVKDVVLVHGAFVDSSGWRGVYDDLTARGYNVRAVQNPLTSLEDDVAATTRVLDTLSGPAILVGHSWGGTVITQAGDHPKVVGLVYVAALVPDIGETTTEQYEPYPPATEFVIDTSSDGFGFIRADKFHAAFAADMSEADAAFLRDTQVPIAMSSFGVALTKAAWRTRPSWAVIFGEDRAFGDGMLHGMARRIGANIVDAPGSHAGFVTQAATVADTIDKAAREVSQASQAQR